MLWFYLLNHTCSIVSDCQPTGLVLSVHVCYNLDLVLFQTSDSKHHRKTLSTSKVDRVYELMNKRRVKGFYNYVTSPSLRDGCLSLLQTAGLGKLKPNTIMLGFKSDWERCDMESVSDYVHIVQ